MERSDCGGFYEPIMSLDMALRSAKASVAIHRDIVALALNSYGNDQLTPVEMAHCLDDMMRALLVEEASRSHGRYFSLEEQRNEAAARLEEAQRALAEFVAKRKERLTKELVFSDLAGFEDLIERTDIDMDATLCDTVHTPINESQHNPHTPPNERAAPATPVFDASAYDKMVKKSKARDIFKHDQDHKARLKKNVATYAERVLFFDTLMRPNEQLTKLDVFAPLFLYAFAFTRAVQRVACAEYCNSRPSNTRQLHPSRHYTFVACLPMLFEHYFLGNVTRDGLVLLARHLHAYSFVPLLSQDDIDKAMEHHAATTIK